MLLFVYWKDFDNDGYADLLVTADFGESRMFWNMGYNRSFWECTEHCGLRGEQVSKSLRR